MKNNRRIEPRAHGYRRRKIDMEALAQDVRDDPDACQSERAARFGVCPNVIHQALKKLEVSDKKTFGTPGRTSPLPGDHRESKKTRPP